MQICRELSIVKETVRQSHFLGRGDSRFFQVAGNHLIINYPCLSPGNYPSYQTSNGREWCTDPQTGWRVKFIFFCLIFTHLLALFHREYKNDFFVCRKVSNAVDASKKCCLDSSRLPSLDLWGPQVLPFSSCFLLVFILAWFGQSLLSKSQYDIDQVIDKTTTKEDSIIPRFFYLCFLLMFPRHRVTPSSSADMGRRTPVTLAKSR